MPGAPSLRGLLRKGGIPRSPPPRDFLDHTRENQETSPLSPCFSAHSPKRACPERSRRDGRWGSSVHFMNERAAGLSKKSHTGDNREIPPFKKQGATPGTPPLSSRADHELHEVKSMRSRRTPTLSTVPQARQG